MAATTDETDRPAGRREAERRLRTAFLAVPVLAVLGAASAAWSLLLADEHGSPAPHMENPWGDSGCVRVAVPVVQYWAGYGSVLVLALALWLYRRAAGAARRRGLDPTTRWDGWLAAFGAVIALCFVLIALFAAYAVTLQGLAIDGAADYRCLL